MLIQRLAPDSGFLSKAADSIIQFYRTHGFEADMSACRVVVPNLLIAPALTRELSRAAGRAVLSPGVDTLSGTVQPWLAGIAHVSDAQRMLILHAQLRRRAWFDEAALWDVVAELTALFDTLTEHALSLPASEEQLHEQLSRAFSLRESAALTFEARVTHTLWRAEAEGPPSRTAARILASHAWCNAQRGPVVFIAEGPPNASQQELLNSLTKRAPVLVLLPDRAEATGSLADVLSLVWPSERAVSLHTRATRLDVSQVNAAIGRVRCLAADSLEALAGEITERVLAWLRAGRRQIALVAADRLAARRVRALLEREGVLVTDETGWKMTTTRVAASVDALLETLVSDGWHRSVVDLLDAPFMFADLPAETRAIAVAQIKKVQVDYEVDKGLDVLAHILDGRPEASELLRRILEARRTLNVKRDGSVVQWLQRLMRALEILGARDAMHGDAAGYAWLEWAQTREAELLTDNERLSFGLWRTWFNREMDAAMFRDRAIESPVIMTHLAATRLRCFDACVIVGADAEHLAIDRPPAWLAHAGVRQELGLPANDDARLRLREDMASLALSSDEVLIAWQSARRDESLLPAADVDSYIVLMQTVLGRSIVESAALYHSDGESPAPRAMPRPVVHLERVPMRLSASGLKALLDCPYRYFSRYVLGLAESDELAQSMEKRDYGERFHLALNTFHREVPIVSGIERDQALEILSKHCRAAFSADVERSYLNHAWWLAAESRLEHYIDWQLEREAEGWRWHAGELELSRPLRLRDGSNLVLRGRIDRVDEHARAAAVSLLDYKTRKIKTLKEQVQDPDDVQLAFYTLMHGGDVTQTAYVALDDERVETVEQDDPIAAADLLRRRIDALFSAMRAGAAMPAHGAISACGRCEMRGVCRQDWFAS